MKKLQEQAKRMQEALKKETVEVNKNGVKVEVRGDQVVISIEVDGVVETRIAEAINDAVRKTQEVAARKLMEMSKEQ
jgi:DNA-binding protein YbaB